MKGSLVLALEDPGGRMSRLGKSEIAHGEILTVNQTLGRIERVTLDDARRVAERVLSQPMTLTVLGPFASERVQGGHGVIRVGVVGAAGRMGREVARAVTADPDLELAAAVDPSHAGQIVEGLTIADTLEALPAAGVEVAVEFTRPAAGPANISWCVEHGVHVVIGTTGFDPDPDVGGAARRRGVHRRRTSRSAPC